jgi:pyrophosphatase PpaX
MANIIFDWSGVISNDFDSTYEAAMAVFKELKISKLSKEEFRRDLEYPYMRFYRKYTKEPKELLDKIFKNAFGRNISPRIYPGALETIKKLKHHNLILLSSHMKENILAEVKEYGLSGFFSEINAEVHDKTEEIHEIMKRNNFKSKDTYYVGDTPHDIRTGKAAGAKTIASTYGHSDKVRLKKENPDYIIEDIKELLDIIK